MASCIDRRREMGAEVTTSPNNVLKGNFIIGTDPSEARVQVNNSNKVVPFDEKTGYFEYDFGNTVIKQLRLFKASHVYQMPDMSACGNWQSMFWECDLEYADLREVHVDNLTSLYGAFYYCTHIKEIDLRSLDTKNVSVWNIAFNACKNLKTIYINLNLESCTDFPNNVLNGCSSLENIFGKVSNVRTSLSFGSCPLTNASAMRVIDGLSEVEESQTITFSKVTFDTLTEEQISKATTKGWEIVHA